MKWLQVLAVAGALIAGVGVAHSARVAPEPAGTITLQVQVTGVRNAKGVMHVDICRQAEFLKACPIKANVPTVAGTTTVRFTNLAPGTYAAQVSHDENSNGKVDRALFGIPKEGVGFSNDAPIRFAPPKWAEAKFPLNEDKVITLKLRYFIGGGARD